MAKQTTFGELKPGATFALSPSHFEYGNQYLNIKLAGYAAWRGPENKKDKTNEEHPFNVIALAGGTPRTFRDEERVFVQEEA
jgi:hypothetical protein